MLILRILLCSFLLVLFSAQVSSAADLTPLLSFEAELIHPGEEVVISAYFHNEGSSVITFEPPYQLQIILERENMRPAQLSAFGLTEEIEPLELLPGNFYKKQYRFTVSPELLGTFQYSVGGYPTLHGLLAVLPAPLTTEIAGTESIKKEESAATEREPDSLEVPEEPETGDRYPTLTNLDPLYQSYAANFSIHEPIYFLVGTDPSKSKFQLSFKYRLFNPSGSLSRDYNWLGGIHLAYTQTSYWDLASDSAPFEDTSYKPELLYQSENLHQRPSWLDGLFLQTGVRHESNGRAGDESRSTNTVYFRPIAMFFDQESQLGFSLSPKAWAYFNNEEDTNGDFADYRGYFELETRVGKAHSLMFTTTLRFAAEGTSFETNATFPIHRFFKNNLDLYLQIQYTNSLAENLIDYQERNEALRIGLSLVR